MTYAYNPYKELETIYNAKIAWGNQTTDEGRATQNNIANNARKRLEQYGYGDLVSQVTAEGATAADVKKILDSYKPATNTTTGTYKTGVTGSPAFDISIGKSLEANEKRDNAIYSDRNDVQGKYNDIYNYANQDITKTDEYQSTYNAIMGKYDLSALQGRDNAIASGGASNGGNIDSYAAANAMRQQAALTAQGQQIAHQAGLDAYNARVSNVGKILSDLGVYNESTYSALQQGVDNYDRTANTVNTALNDQTDRLAKESAVTGYTPSEWTIKNDAIYSEYLNPDGTFKKEKENVDIQALINQAKANGDTETADKLAAVRYKKVSGNWEKFGQFANTGDLGYIKNQQNEEGRQFDKSMDYNYYATDTEKGIKEKEIDANVSMNTDNNQNAIDQINANAEATKGILDHQIKNGAVLDSDGNVVSVDSSAVSGDDGTKINFLNDHFEQDADGNYYAKKIPVGNIEGEDANGNLIASNPELKRSNLLNMDRNGDNMVNAVLDYAAQNGGKLSLDEFMTFIVGHSNEYNTDLKQLKKVLNYFGLPISYLDEYGVVNAGAIGWGDGVKFKTQE